MKNNLINTLNKAVTSNYLEGINWYKDANKFCLEVANKYNLKLFQVVGALAALSPRNKWERNKQDLISVIKYGHDATVCTFSSNRHKAILCLNAESVLEVMVILNGDKVKSFFSNIYYRECDRVTVDIWAMRAVGFNENLTPKKYIEIENVYRKVALEYGYKPKELQAIAWTIIRNGGK